MKAAIGITDTNHEGVADALSKILADEIVLYIKTKNVNWNIQDIDYYEKHSFFESQFEQLDVLIDRVAERIRSTDNYVPLAIKAYLSFTQLTEVLEKSNDNDGFIIELMQDQENIIINLREQLKVFTNDFQDANSSNFIKALMETHEKIAWFLRSYLK